MDNFEIDERVLELSKQAEIDLKDIFDAYDSNALDWSGRVLKAFQHNYLSTADFAEVTGYGYSDGGREKLENVYAELFGAEDALVRPQIMSGTHALSLTLFGLLKYGDTMISISGEPYDSLKSVIGIAGDSRNSLIANGIKYEEIALVDNDFDISSIISRLRKSRVRLVEIQRSRGYSHRKSLSIAKIERVIQAIREVDRDVIIMVDNCYGDMVEDREPTHIGADIIVGSLMKNLGGGLAKTGGYVVGKREYVNDVAERFSAPCIGKDLGANLNQNMSFFQGLYLAPSVVCSALKTATFASYILGKLGLAVDPLWNEPRTDIIQTIDLGSADALVKFCEGVQMASPIESYVKPVPAPMPGYPDDEVMAGGSFVSGATIELSCDGPVTPPYTAYMQGGITYDYGKLGIMLAISKILKAKK